MHYFKSLIYSQYSITEYEQSSSKGKGKGGHSLNFLGHRVPKVKYKLVFRNFHFALDKIFAGTKGVLQLIDML